HSVPRAPRSLRTYAARERPAQVTRPTKHFFKRESAKVASANAENGSAQKLARSVALHRYVVSSSVGKRSFALVRTCRARVDRKRRAGCSRHAIPKRRSFFAFKAARTFNSIARCKVHHASAASRAAPARWRAGAAVAGAPSFASRDRRRIGEFPGCRSCRDREIDLDCAGQSASSVRSSKRGRLEF